MKILEAKNITKMFPGVVALDSVDVAFEPGEIHAIIGENGAGKSTLIKCLTGVYEPEEGEVLVGGKNARKNKALFGVLPVKRTMKNKNFSSVSQVLAGGIFTLPAMQVRGIPLVSLHAIFAVASVYYNNLCNYLSFLPVLPGL